MNAEVRKRRLAAEENERDLKKLQVAAGMMPAAKVERLDWMYEQASTKTNDELADDLMNTTLKGQKDADVENMKKLQGGSAAGSLFLKSATSATEDMMRKLRDDPLFQIKQAEVRRKESIMANPLLRERFLKKQQRKEQKMEKKMAKKAKKLAKKKRKRSSSSSSSSAGGASVATPRSPPLPGTREARSPPRGTRGARTARSPPLPGTRRARSRSRGRRRSRSRGRASGTFTASSDGLKRREQFHGRGEALSAEEKARKLQEMISDGKKHEEYKDTREKQYVESERKLEELEKNMRDKGDRAVFKKMNADTYMSGSVSMEDRIKSGRHRRQKGLFDPLERD